MPTSDTVTAALALTLLGPMQVRVQGQLLPAFRSRKALWLLALLSLRANRPVEREWLSGMLWPDVVQNSAFANLRPVLSELRSALATEGTRLQSPDAHTLRLDLTDAEVDVLEFDAAIKHGTFSDLERAVSLYSGPLLEGCMEEWVFPERALREQNCLHALQKLGDAALSSGDYDKACGYYQRAVGLDPFREAARRGWMEALAKQGDTNAALQVYRQFVAFLKDDPQATPDEKTTELYARLREEARQRASRQATVARAGTHAIAADAVVVPTETPVPKVSGYLPHPITNLIGREDERLEVGICLRRSRLVTLIGPGGIGKTRLAREVASEVVKEYPDGVWLVALESLSEGRLVIQQVASVLGLKEERDRSLLQRVTEYLRNKRLLLVLDNCEHLLEASAEVAGQLLRECGQVRILATSREALGITGEMVWSVPALAVPDTQHLPQGQATLLRVLMSYESVQLFVERAQAVQTRFALNDNNARTVAQVCHQLEGIPLAIELAAARVKVLTAEQLAARLNDHLGLLTSGSRTAPSRQQTLRATLDWSYDLLSKAEQCLLKRLSVFAGGCSLEAAEQICAGEGVEEGQVLDLLVSLVDKSLVVFEQREQAEGRYRLLEMVRQYAAEGLQGSEEAEKIRTRHRDWFLALAEKADLQLQGSEQANWLRRLETEHANLRAALVWSERDAEGAQTGLRLAGALYRFWDKRGDFNDGRAYLGRALEREGAQGATVARAKALNGAGVLAHRQGDYETARTLNEEALTLQRALGDREGIARSLKNLGHVADSQGNHGAARTLMQESLAIRRDLGDKWGVAESLYSLGNVAYAQGDYGAAQTLLQESLAECRKLGDKAGIAESLYYLGILAHSQSDQEAARTLLQESLAIRRELGDKWGIAESLYSLGIVANAQYDFEEARMLYEQSLAIRRELGDKPGIAILLYYLGVLAHSKNDLEEARRQYEQALEVYREIGHFFLIHVLGAMGHLARGEGNYAQAITFYQESLLLRQEMGDVLTIACSLEDFAWIAGRQGQCERALRLLGAAEMLYAPLGRTQPVGNEREYKRTIAAARAALSEEAFASAREQGQAMTMEQAIEYALQDSKRRPAE